MIIAPLPTMPFQEILRNLPHDIFLTGSRYFTNNYRGAAPDWDWFTLNNEQTIERLLFHNFELISKAAYVGNDPTVIAVYRKENCDIQLIRDFEALKIKQKVQEIFKTKTYWRLEKPARKIVWGLLIQLAYANAL